MRAELVERALRGEGPLFDAMLAERARELAAVPAAPGVAGALTVLVLTGRGGRWVLPLAEASRVEPLEACTPLPQQPAQVLGLALLAGRRCLVLDADVAMGATAPGPPPHGGHVVLLRRYPVALAAPRVEGIEDLPPPDEVGGRMLADGSLLVDADAVVAALGRGGRP